MSADQPGIPSPWVLLDDLTVDHIAVLLERLVDWLNGPPTTATTGCARALSRGETEDPESVAGWADALAARLHHRIAEGHLDPNNPPSPWPDGP